MFNFTRFCQDNRLTYLATGHHHCHAGWLQTHCPQCAGAREGYHLGFNIQRGYLNCWRCGRLRLDSFVSQILSVSIEKARDILRDYNDGSPTGERKKKAKARRRRLVAPPGLGPLKRRHREYLEGRGLDPEEMEALWLMQGTLGLSGRWNWRVVFPVMNVKGDTIAYGGRSILSKELEPRKYLMTEDSQCLEDPRGFVYGIDKVPGDTVLVVEGPSGVWKCGPGTVGTLGIAWRFEQINALRRFKNRFIYFDPEPLAQKRAKQLAEWLALFEGTTEIIEDMPSDPGDLKRKAVNKLRRMIGLEAL